MPVIATATGIRTLMGSTTVLADWVATLGATFARPLERAVVGLASYRTNSVVPRVEQLAMLVGARHILFQMP